MGEIRFGGVPCRVTRATCELYHLYFAEPDWSLEAETDGIFPRLAVSGRLAAPALPGPSELGLAYIDDPSVVVLDGKRGSLAPRAPAEPPGSPSPRSRLSLVELPGGRVRIEGTLQLVWRSLVAEDDPRDYAIELSLEAALVT
jgi:hypothetical protein